MSSKFSEETIKLAKEWLTESIVDASAEDHTVGIHSLPELADLFTLIRDNLELWGSPEESNWQGVFADLAGLLDAIESAAREGDRMKVRELVKGRFEIFERHGFKVEFTGMPVSDGSN